MFVKQVMARPVPAHPKWKYSLNRESMILFFHKKILYGANVVYAEGWHVPRSASAGMHSRKTAPAHQNSADAGASAD